MRVVVCPHDMGMGGSQINAIDLAAAVQARGHEVMLYAPRGPLVDRALSAGLAWTPAPTGLRLSLRWALGLGRLVRTWRADLVHSYEWVPALGAAFGAHLLLGTPQVMTVLSMEVPDFLPRHLDLVVGTEKLAAGATAFGHRHVLEPPVDTDADAPRPAGPARRELGLRDDDLVVSVVGRLTTDLHKSAGVLATIESVARLASTAPVVLVVAGDGDDGPRVREAAERVNARHGRRVVHAPGTLMRPGSAYAAADVVVGMGSSVLRGMAHGRPAVVLGESGFTRPVCADTIGEFFWEGFFGVGDGGPYPVHEPLARLLADPAEARRRGEWSRALVVERFGLRRAAEILDGVYRGALARSEGERAGARVAHRAGPMARSARSVTGFVLHRTHPRRAAA